MKKCSALLLLMIAACYSTVFATVPPAKLFILSGTLKKDNLSELVLMKVHEGKRIVIAASKKDKDNNFAFALANPEEGFYYVGERKNIVPIRFYVKQGDALTIDINDDGYKVVTGSQENKILADWAAATANLRKPGFDFLGSSATFEEYFKNLNAFLPEAKKFSQKVATPNKKFNALMKMAIDFDVEYDAMHYLLVPHSVHATKADYPAYYSQIIRTPKFTSAAVLQLGEFGEYMSNYVAFYSLMGDRSEKPLNRLEWSANLFGNDTLKGAFIANNMDRFRTYDEFTKNVDPLKKYLVTDSMMAVYFQTLKKLSGFKKGSASYNFSYEDINGNKVSMESLKGKVVLIDVWATWCGPCKKELPFLKTLEEEMKDKNVTFVSLSVDDEKDKQKWKDFVKSEQLGGTQLFASGWNDIGTFYDIKGIPRFMVFDKEGKIVTIDAPRPSEPELKTLLNATLEGK
jgi:thiol-disulfide isomerase/thioredoxin